MNSVMWKIKEGEHGVESDFHCRYDGISSGQMEVEPRHTRRETAHRSFQVNRSDSVTVKPFISQYFGHYINLGSKLNSSVEEQTVRASNVEPFL